MEKDGNDDGRKQGLEEELGERGTEGRREVFRTIHFLPYYHTQ